MLLEAIWLVFVASSNSSQILSSSISAGFARPEVGARVIIRHKRICIAYVKDARDDVT